MSEEALKVLSLTTEQLDERHQKAAFLYTPLTFEGDLIRNSIIDKNRLAAEADPRIGDLIGLYVRLKEYELTGASPTGPLAREWISLVANSCELILKEGESQSPESFRLLKGMFEGIYGKFKGLFKQKPRHLFKSLAFIIGESLKENGVNFSTDEIERNFKRQYEENKEISDLVKLDTFLPWVFGRKL